MDPAPEPPRSPGDPGTRPGGRHPGPDVVRALALAGVVVMNFHGYLVIRGARPGDGRLASIFDPWTGPLSTRFAATFVLVAGVGVTLLTASAAGDPERVRVLRWRLASRGLVLYAFGLAFDLVWNGTILPFIGAMLALGALVFTLRSSWVLAIGLAAAIASWALRWWRFEQAASGQDTSWLFAPPRGSIRTLVFDVAVNGTHPLLPWLAFFCAGIVVGRAVVTAGTSTTPASTTTWWAGTCVGAGFVLLGAVLTARAVLSSGAPDQRREVLLSTDPFERGGLYTASALATALIAFGIIVPLADRFASTGVIDVLRRAGQLSLSIYVLHALVFNLVVDWLGWVEPGGLGTALVFALVVWVVGVAAAVAWQRRRGIGPLEHVYRSITA